MILSSVLLHIFCFLFKDVLNDGVILEDLYGVDQFLAGHYETIAS